MTREELVQMREYQVGTASTEYWNKNKDNDEVGIMTAFEDGVAWADEHPKNPWISVEERLPEKLENDCASYYVLTRMDGPRQIWYMVNRYNYDIKSWEGCSNNTTHWMPIPSYK